MSHFSIVQVPADNLSQFWPAIGPLLVAGAFSDGDADFDAELESIAEGVSHVWMIVEADKVLAAFITRAVDDSDGKRTLHAYGLGGTGQLRWGKFLTDALVDYGKAAKCARIACKGRKALKRTYPGFRIVAQESANRFVYERAL